MRFSLFDSTTTWPVKMIKCLLARATEAKS
jgi:hypothetical protein